MVAQLGQRAPGQLDLANSDLLTQTAVGTIRGYLASAYDGGDWSGSGITSSVAQGNPNQYGIGYAAGSDPHNPRPDVPAGAVLVRPTLVGDINLDGKVNFFDITQLLGYKYNTGQPASYTDGDINYDGKVNFLDLSLLLSANYNTGQTFSAMAAAAAATNADITVPEPAGLAVLGIGAVGLMARRRRRGASKGEEG